MNGTVHWSKHRILSTIFHFYKKYEIVPLQFTKTKTNCGNQLFFYGVMWCNVKWSGLLPPLTAGLSSQVRIVKIKMKSGWVYLSLPFITTHISFCCTAPCEEGGVCTRHLHTAATVCFALDSNYHLLMQTPALCWIINLTSYGQTFEVLLVLTANYILYQVLDWFSTEMSLSQHWLYLLQY